MSRKSNARNLRSNSRRIFPNWVVFHQNANSGLWTVGGTAVAMQGFSRVHWPRVRTRCFRAAVAILAFPCAIPLAAFRRRHPTVLCAGVLARVLGARAFSPAFIMRYSTCGLSPQAPGCPLSTVHCLFLRPQLYKADAKPGNIANGAFASVAYGHSVFSRLQSLYAQRE